jgi:hypothetical protein
LPDRPEKSRKKKKDVSKRNRRKNRLRRTGSDSF